MKNIKFESIKKLEFEWEGITLLVYSKKIGQFLVLSDLRGKRPSMPEIGDNECRPIGVRIPKGDLYLAIATELAGGSIISFQVQEEVDEAVFLLR